MRTVDTETVDAGVELGKEIVVELSDVDGVVDDAELDEDEDELELELEEALLDDDADEVEADEQNVEKTVETGTEVTLVEDKRVVVGTTVVLPGQH